MRPRELGPRDDAVVAQGIVEDHVAGLEQGADRGGVGGVPAHHHHAGLGAVMLGQRFDRLAPVIADLAPDQAVREAAEEARQSDKTERQRKSASQNRSEANTQLAKQSLREIYRKLASAVHPDRESDPQRREAMMPHRDGMRTHATRP